MNKNIFLFAAVAVSGVIAGYLVSGYNSTQPAGAYFGKTVSITSMPTGLIVNQPLVKVEFKSNQEYELLYLTNKQVGFSSGGDYLIEGDLVSLQQSKHDKIVPERELEFYEKVMIADGAILSSDSMRFLTLNENEFLLVSEYGMSHFCKGSPCDELPSYAN